MSGDSEAEFGLLMPFLPVESRGGPFPDDAYVAGWEMGRTDAVLGTAAALGLTPDTGLLIHRENREQVDLLAMHHGFTTEYEPIDGDEWVRVDFSKYIPDEDGEESGDE